MGKLTIYSYVPCADYLLAELAAVKIIAVKRPVALSTLSKGVNEISEVVSVNILIKFRHVQSRGCTILEVPHQYKAERESDPADC